jgi:membrane protein YdbS with pleckstrin-like domain
MMLSDAPGSSTLPAGATAGPEAPPSIADGVERSLDPRAVALDRVVGWILTGSAALVLLAALVLALLLAPLSGWAKAALALLWAAVTLALAWFSYRWPEVEHRHAFYKVDGQGIEIRRGVFWRKVINVPRSRVQHTDVAQGPLERRYGLGRLVVYTAGTDYARVDLRGLDHATALAIRDHLLAGEGGDAV